MRKTLLITLSLLFQMTLACAQNEVTVFLDWRIDDTVSLLDKPGGEILHRLACKNDTNPDEVVMMTILALNDSMYQVSVFDDSAEIGIGWIYKNAPVRVCDRFYLPNNTLEIFRQPNGTKLIATLTETSDDDGLLQVVDVNLHNRWLKIRIKVGNKIIEGWIEPSSYCSNPYTTCG